MKEKCLIPQPISISLIFSQTDKCYKIPFSAIQEYYITKPYCELVYYEKERPHGENKNIYISSFYLKMKKEANQYLKKVVKDLKTANPCEVPIILIRYNNGSSISLYNRYSLGPFINKFAEEEDGTYYFTYSRKKNNNYT